jgi:type IV secretion system protein VirB4
MGRRKTGLAAWGRREQRAGDWLPYARLLDPRTVMLRNGALMQVLHLEGFAFETADTEDVDHRLALRDTLLRALAHSRLVVHHHVIRRRVEVRLEGRFEDPVCAAVDEHWQARLASRQLYVNDLFLTLERRPAKGRVGWADAVSRWTRRRLDGESSAAALARDLEELNASRELLTAALGGYQPRLLSDYETAAGCCSEPLEFLSALYNGVMRPVLRPGGDIGQYLPYKRISFGLDTLELTGPADRSFAAILSLKEYPAHTTAHSLDALLRLPFELVLSESFAFADRQTGLERISTAVRRMRAADEDSLTLKQGLIDAKDDLASGRTAFGEHHLSLLVRAPEPGALNRAVGDAVAALADIGAVAVRETLNLEPAFWAQFPGNTDLAARKALISTSNFAGFAALHGHPMGQADGGPWGPAVTAFETTSATPYFFNFHQGDLGNFTVIGPSGSGKTVVLNFLAAQAQRLGPRTVLFDKDRGSEIFIRAIGGRYNRLRSGHRTGFNPLQIDDSPAARAFLRSWIARLATRGDQPPSAEEEQIIAEAIDANFEQDRPLRRLRYFLELLGGAARPDQDDLTARLAPWCGSGERAWLFDNPSDELDLEAQTLGFDITEVLDDPTLRTPVMMYVFHRIETRLDGHPTMILIDEGWKALDDEVFSARIRDWMKTLRKRNAILGFATQNASDALESRIASAVVEQAATQIFMPNPKAQAADYCDGFRLTVHELDLVRALPAHARCFLVKQGAQSVVARLDLGAAPDLLTLLSGRESAVRRLDEIRGRRGDSVADWWPELIGGPFPGGESDRPAGNHLRAAE